MFLGGIGPCLVAQAAGQRGRCYVSKRYRAVAVDLLFGENSRRRQIRTANGGVLCCKRAELTSRMRAGAKGGDSCSWVLFPSFLFHPTHKRRSGRAGMERAGAKARDEFR